MSMTKDEINAVLNEADGWTGTCYPPGVAMCIHCQEPHFIEVKPGHCKGTDYTDPANFSKLLELERKVYGAGYVLELIQGDDECNAENVDFPELEAWGPTEPHARSKVLAMVIRRQKTTPERA